MDLGTLLDTPPWDWPKDAGRILQKTLTDHSAKESDRIIAADLAGEAVVINDDLAGVLLEVVSDAHEPAELRATAAISLGPILEAETYEFDDRDEITVSKLTFRRIQEALKNLYLDSSIPKIVRRRILEAAVRSPDPWQGDAIRNAYSSTDREWMLTAVFAMGHSGL